MTQSKTRRKPVLSTEEALALHRDALVIDTVDAAEAPSIEELGMRVLVTPTVMRTDDDKDAPPPRE